jgi:hypothetical protein
MDSWNGFSTSALCAPGPRTASTRAATPPRAGSGDLRRGQSGKYADQDSFIPFILETGGRVRQQSTPRVARHHPEQGKEVLSQDDHDPRKPYGGRTTTETVVREAMQAGAGARASPHADEDSGDDPLETPCCEQEPYQ